MQTSTPWNTQTPTRAGWYMTSMEGVRSADMRRYWNGTAWSAPCYADDPADIADRARNTPSESVTVDIEWRGVAS